MIPYKFIAEKMLVRSVVVTIAKKKKIVRMLVICTMDITKHQRDRRHPIQKHLPCWWNNTTNIIEVSILLKGIYRIDGIVIKIPMIFTDLDKMILTFIWKQKRPQIAKAIFSNKNKA